MESVEQLAQRWISESRNGIGNSGIRPGFIKIGVDDGKLSEIDAKIVRAAAVPHKETGLVIAAHTGNNIEAVETQIKILQQEKVDPSAWIWVHANKVERNDDLLRVADTGAWIELDGISETTIDHNYSIIEEFRKRGLENRLLLSHDENLFDMAIGHRKRITHSIPS